MSSQHTHECMECKKQYVCSDEYCDISPLVPAGEVCLTCERRADELYAALKEACGLEAKPKVTYPKIILVKADDFVEKARESVVITIEEKLPVEIAPHLLTTCIADGVGTWYKMSGIKSNPHSARN